MPASPDFDQFAQQTVARGFDEGDLVRAIAEHLRLAWNARGTADIAKVDATLAYDGTSRTGLDAMLDRALRSLDR
jgi:hypothetical protein